MSDPDGVNRKFFEKALDEHQQATKAFSRNVRIVALLLVAFQFIIFFRFVDLDDRRHDLDVRIAQLTAERGALTAVDEHIGDLAATLDPLSVRLRETPDALHEQIRVLDDYIRRLREEPSADNGRSPSPRQAPLVDAEPSPEAQSAQQQEVAQEELPQQPQAQQIPQQQQIQQGVTQHQQQQQQPASLATETGSLLVYLDAPEQQEVREILRRGDPPEDFDALITDLINDHIVPAIFTGLNEYKNNDVVPAYQRERAELFRALDSEIVTSGEGSPSTPTAVLGDAAGAPAAPAAPAWAENVKNIVSDVETRLVELEFNPPLDEEWVRDYSAKLVVFDQLEALVDEFRYGLGEQELTLQVLHDSLTQQLEQGSIESGHIAAEIAQLEAEYAQVRDQLSAYPDVLPIVPLELKYAVLYFPALLAIIVAYFAMRYAGLRQQAANLTALAPAYLDAPISTLYLDERILAWRLPPPRRHRRYLRAAPILGAVLLVPVVLAAVSYLRVILSGGLRDELTWWLVFLYVGTAAMLVAACLALPAPSPLNQSDPTGSRFQSQEPNPPERRTSDDSEGD